MRLYKVHEFIGLEYRLFIPLLSMVKAFIFIVILMLYLENSYAQDAKSIKGKIEVKVMVSIQNPRYASSFRSLFADYVYGKARYRTGLGVGLRYYLTNQWYSEYRLAYSPEGGGYQQQHTNLNILKNTVLFGHSAKHTYRLMFDFYTGIDVNTLLTARFKAAGTTKTESVAEFYKRVSFSLPVGIGFKSKITQDVWLSLQAYGSLSLDPVTTQSYAKTSQVLLPGVNLSVSKLL